MNGLIYLIGLIVLIMFILSSVRQANRCLRLSIRNLPRFQPRGEANIPIFRF
jgi:hypothetical protein